MSIDDDLKWSLKLMKLFSYSKSYSLYDVDCLSKVIQGPSK